MGWRACCPPISNALGSCHRKRTRSHDNIPNHKKFAFIKARWHADIVDQSYLGFTKRLDELEVNASVETFDVPGAFEMPLLAKRLAMTGRFDAIAAAALVVDGDIYRHEFVAQSVVTGLMDVGLQTGVPVLSVSLTPHNFHGSEEHHAFFRDHFVKKGTEAADAAVQILAVHSGLPVPVSSAAA